MQNRFKTFLYCVFSIAPWIMLAVSSPAAENIRIESGGIALVSDGNIAQSKEASLKDAFKNAVKQIIENGTFNVDFARHQNILEDKIYSDASAYISNFRIITEEMVQETVEGLEKPLTFYKVSVEISIAVSILHNDLKKLGLIINAEGSEKSVTLTITDIYDYSDFIKLKNFLKELKGVKEIFYRTFARGRIIIGIKTSYDTSALKDTITSKELDGLKVEATDVSGDIINLKIIKHVPESSPIKDFGDKFNQGKEKN